MTNYNQAKAEHSSKKQISPSSFHIRVQDKTIFFAEKGLSYVSLGQTLKKHNAQSHAVLWDDSRGVSTQSTC